ncbi:MAG: phosphoribosyltransferase [Cytophagales bacterium]|nr:phosphoribosyltransferase [Cytophagales bacterium]
MAEQQVRILNTQEVERKIKRIAYQIFEENHEEKSIILAGIPQSGLHLAELIQEQLRQISPLDVHLIPLEIDKSAPFSSKTAYTKPPVPLSGRVVVLVDDVLNTGKTILKAVKPFLETELKSLQTAVLVNRSHLAFPIAATYTGLELATTLNEHIEVLIEENRKEVFLR